MFRKMQLSAGVGAALAAVLLLGACASSDRATAPPVQTSQGTPCGGGTGVVQLAALQGTVLDCSTGTTITLAGNGASYLVVPNLAAGESNDVLTQYVIGASGVSATASVASLPSAATLAGAAAGVLNQWAAVQRSRPGLLQREFDARMRHLNARRLAAAGGPGSVRLSVARASVATVPPPPVGSLRQFHVLATLDTVNLKFQRITAQLKYVGTNVLVYVDTTAPASFTAADFANFATTFDQVLYPIDLNAFGAPSDIDNNGRLIMLMSPVVNSLTPASECSTQGYIAGFFDGGDLVDTDTTSNQGEIFYALAPDPNGKFSCAHAPQGLEDQLGATFLHEVQHLINFSQHVLVHNGNEEEGWLDEGLSLIAEELGSRYYEDKYPAPLGRSTSAQLFPDSSQGYIVDLLSDSYSYALLSDTTTLTLHSDADNGLAWRGGDWVLLRWLGDQKGGANFYRALVQTPLTGIANIEAAAGESFPSLFGDFSTALYTDSLPGVPRSQVPAQDRFSTRNFRLLWWDVYRVAGPSLDVPYPFPIQAQPLPASGTLSGLLVPGAMAYYQATASPSASTITITFATPSGGSLPSSLHPQVSVFRLQ